MAKLLNAFLLGADPEGVFYNKNSDRIQNAMYQIRQGQTKFFGYDHGGFVVEPHPDPEFSARRLCNNIKKCLAALAWKADPLNLPFIAPAYIAGANRVIGLGGHVHLDMPALNAAQLQAMDLFTESLEDLDLLPTELSRSRRENTGYGRYGDTRSERGRVEYRSMPSWLFSRRIAMTAITGVKLCAVAPETVPLEKFDSKKSLTAWFEQFQNADDDARWIVEKDYFGGKKDPDPFGNVFRKWGVDKDKGQVLLEEELHSVTYRSRTGIEQALHPDFLEAAGFRQAARDIPIG